MKPPAFKDMTDAEKSATLEKVIKLFSIGSHAATESTILINVSNAMRRLDCLRAVESHLTVKTLDENGEECFENPLSWGDTPEQYAKRFAELVPAPT